MDSWELRGEIERPFGGKDSKNPEHQSPEKRTGNGEGVNGGKGWGNPRGGKFERLIPVQRKEGSNEWGKIVHNNRDLAKIHKKGGKEKEAMGRAFFKTLTVIIGSAGKAKGKW